MAARLPTVSLKPTTDLCPEPPSAGRTLAQGPSCRCPGGATLDPHRRPPGRGDSPAPPANHGAAPDPTDPSSLTAAFLLGHPGAGGSAEPGIAPAVTCAALTWVFSRTLWCPCWVAGGRRVAHPRAPRRAARFPGCNAGLNALRRTHAEVWAGHKLTEYRHGCERIAPDMPWKCHSSNG